MNTRILIVEDAADLRDIVADLLRTYDYLVDVAIDGQDALEKIAMGRPDVILSDMRMPRMDGPTLKSRLMEDPQTSAIPLIFMSAYAPEDNQSIEHFIRKPFTINQLMSALSHSL